MVCLVVTFFFSPTLSHKQHDFRGGGGGGEVTDHKMCGLIFSTNFFSEIFLIIKIIGRDITINVNMPYLNSLYSSQILIKYEFFSTDYRKIFEYKMS